MAQAKTARRDSQVFGRLLLGAVRTDSTAALGGAAQLRKERHGNSRHHPRRHTYAIKK